jgi:peptidoglycan-associated lipoprotein
MAHRLAPLHLRALPLVVGVAALALVGCDAPGFTSKAKSPSQLAKQPVGQTTTTSAGPIKQWTDGDTTQKPAVHTPGLSVSDVIAQACGIAPRAADKNVAPTFEYDSAALGEADREMLAEVARCLTTGALRGKAVSLVGRADARGEPEYNMTLGESRANTVHRYLVDLGVGRDRMRVTSRGEMDATGTDEEGWARDRRVDIELVM